MIKVKFKIAGATLGLIVSVSSVHAQGIPVFDTSNYVQMLAQVSNTLKQIDQNVQQIQQTKQILDQATQTYNSFSKLTNASSVAPVLNNPNVRNILPAEVTDMAKLLSGNTGQMGALGQMAQNYQTKYTLSATDANGNAIPATDYYNNFLKSQTGGSAAMMAFGANTLAIANQRTSGLSQLQQQINTAQDPKDVMDLQVRASIENAHAVNDLMKLQATDLSARAQGTMMTQRFLLNSSRANNAFLASVLAPQ